MVVNLLSVCTLTVQNGATCSSSCPAERERGTETERERCVLLLFTGGCDPSRKGHLDSGTDHRSTRFQCVCFSPGSVLVCAPLPTRVTRPQRPRRPFLSLTPSPNKAGVPCVFPRSPWQSSPTLLLCGAAVTPAEI